MLAADTGGEVKSDLGVERGFANTSSPGQRKPHSAISSLERLVPLLVQRTPSS